MRIASRNLGFVQQFQVGTFNSVGVGQAVEFVFNAMPDFAPGGLQYEVLDVILRFPTGAIQFPINAGQFVTGRTLWSLFKNVGWSLGANTPQAQMRGPSSPQEIFQAVPGVLVADFLAMHSRSRIVDIDGANSFRRTLGQSAAVTNGPVMVPDMTLANDGWAWQHGPFSVGAGTFGVNNQVDYIIPIGRRANSFGMEDFDDAALPAPWLHGKPVKGSGMSFEPSRLRLLMNTVVEGGGVPVLAAGQVVQVWVTALLRRDNRASLPNLPCLRWFAPPGNSTDVAFAPGYHFWSGFGAQDTAGNGNADANFNQLTQSFGTIAIRQGDAYSQYNSATEYLRTLSTMVSAQEQTRRTYGFSADDNPACPQTMAVVRNRAGIFPVALPKPILLGDGSDSFNEFVATYTVPNPVTPYQLQSVYPLHTAASGNLAAQASGIPNAAPCDAIDSQLPESGLSAVLPKTIRSIGARAA